jgi:hypothetical protein
VDDEIASQLSKIAKKEDKTSFAVANECLGEALKICEQGGHPEEIFSAWIMHRIGQEVVAFEWIGKNSMEQLVRDFAHLDEAKFSKLWYDTGFNFGVYLQICFPSIEDVVTLVTQLQFSIGRHRFIYEHSNSIEEGSGSFSLSIVSSYSAEVLTYLAEYWRGLLSAYGLNIVESQIAEGVVKLRFISHGKLMKANPQLIK